MHFAGVPHPGCSFPEHTVVYFRSGERLQRGLLLGGPGLGSRELLQEVRYVIHTITFFAVFGSEKLHFPV